MATAVKLAAEAGWASRREGVGVRSRSWRRMPKESFRDEDAGGVAGGEDDADDRRWVADAVPG